MRVGEGEGHGFQAGDFEGEGFTLGVVGVATDGTEGFLEEAFLGCVGDFAFERTQTGAFGGEHVVRGLEAGFFASNVCFCDGSRLRAKGLPKGTDGSETGEEGHEGDADDADAFEAGLGERLLGLRILVEVPPV